LFRKADFYGYGKDLSLMQGRPPEPKTLTDRTVLAAQAILSGERRGPAAYLAFAGPGGRGLDRVRGPR
jgi:hypothetical protein